MSRTYLRTLRWLIKMASSLPNAGIDWKSIPTHVSIKSSNRAFYGKYKYSVNWRFPFAFLLRDWKLLNFDLESRISSYRENSYNRKWLPHIKDDEVAVVRGVYQTISDCDTVDFRFRIEGSYITFFSNDESFLFNLTQAATSRANIHNIIVCKPSSEKNAEMLLLGCIKSNIPFKYKAVTRITEMTTDEKGAILNILNQDGHKLNDRLRRTLTEPNPHVVQSHFYTNDMQILTLISLIHPMFIKKIHTIISE